MMIITEVRTVVACGSQRLTRRGQARMDFLGWYKWFISHWLYWSIGYTGVHICQNSSFLTIVHFTVCNKKLIGNSVSGALSTGGFHQCSVSVDLLVLRGPGQTASLLGAKWKKKHSLCRLSLNPRFQ